jgi:RNA polymerase sigma factor (sigma-70 family)
VAARPCPGDRGRLTQSGNHHGPAASKFWQGHEKQPGGRDSPVVTLPNGQAMSGVAADTLGQLWDAYAPSLSAYARQWCRSAEDVVQEAFWHLARQQSLPPSPAAWLFCVVRHRSISAARSEKRRRNHETTAAEKRPAWLMSAPGVKLDAETVCNAMDDLPVELRETMVARLWGGLSFEELAQLTGVSISTAHRRYEAGLAALRRRFVVESPHLASRATDGMPQPPSARR